MRFTPPHALHRMISGRGALGALFLLLLLPTCASVYLQNRRLDAADIFTVEVNTRAYGASVRVGPLKAGAYYKDPQGYAAGLRGGRLGSYHSAEFTALFFGADYFSELPLPHLLPPQPPAAKAAKGTEEGKKAEESKTEQTKAARAKKKGSKQGKAPGALTSLRSKAFEARAPFGTTAPAHTKKNLLRSTGAFTVPTYFTQIEVSVGLFGGIKIGFNPGELLDFILGWTTMDIYRDDAPYPDPRLEELRRNPMFRDLDEKTQQKILKEMDGFQGLP